jgi:hypothetical protein
MRRLARRLFTLCSAASLLLCVAACALWVRSYRVAELLTHRATHGGATGFTERSLMLARGTAELGQFSSGGTLPARAALGFTRERFAASSVRLPRDTLAQRVGFGFRRLGTRGWSLSVPGWGVAGLALLPPALWLHRRRIERRRRARSSVGLCPACGYDLRASPRRCPECGVAVVTTE